MVKQDGQARTCRQRKTPLRGSGDTFAIALKGSLNCIRPLQLPLNTRECGAEPRHGRVDMTMIELTIAENTT
jgi:hypothetical protein